jgi:hypothetical protein
LRIAPSSVPDFPELTGLPPKRRRKPRVAKHCAGRLRARAAPRI